MPFLPMKYPEYRLSMEAALPSSVHSWLCQELEVRGIDSHVYTRYIISLLLQDDEDLDGLDLELLSGRRKGRHHLEKQHRSRRSGSEEDRKKLAAIQCLSAVTDEKSGIETLVDELCSRLKDTEIKASVSPASKSRSCSSDGSDDSSTENQNPAQRYYAAFPALLGKNDASTNPSPSETIWRNNPLVNKSLASLTSEEDSSSANEDAEIRKINIPCHVVVPKNRKPRKNNSRNRRVEIQGQGSHRGRKERSRPGSSKGQSHKGVCQGQKELEQAQQNDIPNWPPGFARLDPVILQNLELLDVDLDEEMLLKLQDRVKNPKRPNDELCTRVESLLKGMLLPVPEKTYKNLQDVDEMLPEELREKSEKKPAISKSKEAKENIDVDVCEQFEDSVTPEARLDSCVQSLHEESVSPELKEQESWYTQPIDVLFYSQEDDDSDQMSTSSKLRLYKRNSYPLFSPDSEPCDSPLAKPTTSSECIQSSFSSPVLERSRCQSIASDASDEIFEGSVLIPSWLTEVLSADEGESLEEIDLSASLKSSSPFVPTDAVKFSLSQKDLENIESIWNKEEESLSSSMCQAYNFPEDPDFQPVQADDNSTPTPTDACVPSKQHTESQSSYSSDRPSSVTLIDWDYMSQFIGITTTPEWHSLSPEEGLTIASPRRPGLSTLWQSQVLFDHSLYMADSLDCMFKPRLETCDLPCWQPLGTYPYTQLWDVNMQKRASKVSPWGGPLLPTDNQIWLEENTLVFMKLTEGDQHNCSIDFSENTLIPTIRIDVNPEEESAVSAFIELDSDLDLDHSYHLFDRSTSMGDVPLMWEDERNIGRKKADPQLSKSFELVPSEHSAFCDVPRNLLHVRSEPNLAQYRQEMLENNPETHASPQEHLFFSPKTHFRPITPANAPEICVSKAKQQVCHDLFGGLPSTKTPLLQYHGFESKSECDDEESFIPSFKVKNYSKSIQTGDSFDKVESPVTSDSSVERDTPETLTMSVIENVMGDRDNFEQLLTIVEDADAANTDSAYETDYGTSQAADPGDSERTSQAEGGHHSKNCLNNNGVMAQSQGFFDCNMMDHGSLGDACDFKVQSFLATFPHKQDWPDGPCQLAQPTEKTWKDLDQTWNDMESDRGNFVNVNESWFPHEHACGTEGELEQPPEFPVCDQAWGEDLALEHLHGYGDENDMDKYKNIWSTAGQDFYSVDIGMHGDASVAHAQFYDCTEEYDNVSPEDLQTLYSNLYYQQDDDSGEYYDNVDLDKEEPLSEADPNPCTPGISTSSAPQGHIEAIHQEKIACMEPVIPWHTDSPDYAGFPKVAEQEGPDTGMGLSDIEGPIAGDGFEGLPHDFGDYYSVKLVNRDKCTEGTTHHGQHQKYGSYDLMPMPDEAVTATELEREWLENQILWLNKKPSSAQRKPCSFFLEGNCRRSDCKFAHDISNITCRFWEEGGCFKGPLCPFLHGYPSEQSPRVPESVEEPVEDKDKFDLNTDEFPELSLSVKNGNTTAVNHKKSRSGKVQNVSGTATGSSNNKREKNRRGNARRHSNKENRCEVKIVNKCSSSI